MSAIRLVASGRGFSRAQQPLSSVRVGSDGRLGSVALNRLP